MRNDVPGGKNVGEFLPSGVEKAGGAGGEGLIEHLRKRIRVLEQVPVSLAFPPAPDTGPLPRPACSLLASVPSLPLSSLGAPANANPSPGKGEGGDGHRPSPGGGHAASAIRSDPHPGPPPFRGREVPWSKLAAAGLHEIKPAAYRDAPAALAFALAFIGDRLVKREDAAPLLWCLTDRAAREWGAPYGPGLISFGLDPALILIVQARNGMDAAWALGRGAESPRLHRRSRPDRGEGADHRKTPRACRADEPHALPAPVRPSGERTPRHPHPLACGGGAK